MAAATPVDSFHRETLHLFGIPHPGHDIQQRLETAGAKYLRIDDVLASSPSFGMTAEESDILEISIQSALITYYRTDAPDRNIRRIAKTAQRLRREGEQTYSAVTALLRQGNFVEAYLPNGRFPCQKMATLAARAQQTPTIHYEKGETPNGAYVQPYAPQDRLASQGAVNPLLSALTPSEIEVIADKWLARRAPSKESRNEFAAGWTEGLPAEFVSRMAGHKVAGFFTSSQDEFQFLGPEWQLHTWESQVEAFDLLMSRFEQEGYVCYLRVHPNLATKAHECFLREREGSWELARRHPNLVVIWHDDPTSSYSLLENTNSVVVWDSTVGLETSASGIPTWTCATSRYGLVADVRELLGPENLAESSLMPWNVVTEGAKRFIAYLVLRDDQMPELTRPWISWDNAHPPLPVKIAALFVSGGAPSIRDALTATFDVWRHRRASFNKSALKSRLAR
ncbi:hypothetical protein [Alpinimonas psychrophila]|uniref:Capsule polysaccharide biosynthesis protein n=1 Tax=Alpinimonas psychrophila TaxID=748908 RepID=A0A7W3JU30_9MICO|nr:hypothetical protein [Alpinimonas psychrophila]MBA8829274.1 hypothetical protein [Alpinimonas psychrophila]